MKLYSALLVLLFEINSSVPSKNFPLIHTDVNPDDSIQVSKNKGPCSYNNISLNCGTFPYLLNSSDYKSDRQFFNGNLTKPVYPVLPKVRLPRTTFSLKGRLNLRAKINSVTQPYVTHRNIRKKINNTLFRFKHKHHNHNSTVSTTEKNGIRHSENNLILNEKEKVDGTTSRNASTIYTSTTKFKENKIQQEENKIFNFSNKECFGQFKQSLEQFDSKFYQSTFSKLTAITWENRTENGISFLQSGLLLYLALLAISTEVDLITKFEIDSSLMHPSSVMEKLKLSKHVIAWLPVSNHNLKFRWASRLVLEEGLRVSQGFVGGIANSSNLHVEQFNSTDTTDNIFDKLNHMVEIDSGGAMRNTFIEDDFSEGFCSVFISTMYIRARWRVAPTVLNGTYPFKDGNGPYNSVRMIKLNDMMGYTPLIEWDAEAIEIRYASPGLTLLLLIPRINSISNLITHMKTTTPQEISNKMRTVRVAATLPIYTLRMTLLLPGKLQMMNISRLVDAKLDNNGKCGQLRLSHAVQRLMFWAEAGRNAFKDDGIEWDEAPDVELMADRPYLFYVRWKNVTLMNGNFVL